MAALAPIYKCEKEPFGKGKHEQVVTGKSTNARTSVESQRRAISDEYEAARAKVYMLAYILHTCIRLSLRFLFFGMLERMKSQKNLNRALIGPSKGLHGALIESS